MLGYPKMPALLGNNSVSETLEHVRTLVEKKKKNQGRTK